MSLVLFKTSYRKSSYSQFCGKAVDKSAKQSFQLFNRELDLEFLLKDLHYNV